MARGNLPKANLQNEKVLGISDESFPDDNIDECESDEITAVSDAYATAQMGIEPSNVEINHWFNQLPIRILNSHEMPFFYLEDIAKVLGIKNARVSVKNFDQSEIVSIELRKKYNIITYCKYKGGVRRNDKAILLTEFGVYRLIMTTRSEKSTEFKQFIYNVLHQLRTKGEYKITRKLQELEITNEQLSAANNTLQTEIDKLKARQNKFQNLCDKIYLIEFPHDPYVIKQPIPSAMMKRSKRLKMEAIKMSPSLSELARAKPNENVINDPYPYALQLATKLNLDTASIFVDVDIDSRGEELKIAHEANVAASHELIREYCPTTSYYITANPTPEQLTSGTCVHSVWVKSSRESLKKLPRGSIYNEKKESLIKMLDAIE